MLTKRYILETIVFLSGAVVMIVELIGSRILAPYVGTSIFVWTSLIGIILASLSLGYAWGGKLADRSPSPKTFGIILFAAGLAIALTAISKTQFLFFIVGFTPDIRVGSVLAVLLLFAPTGILLGMVSPYAVKLKLQTLASSGSTVGNLYAISTVGSIVGTFAAGFLLIPVMPITTLLFALSLIMVLLSLLAGPFGGKRKLMIIVLVFLGSALAISPFVHAAPPERLKVINTSYTTVFVQENVDVSTHRPVRYLITNPKGIQSGMFLDAPAELLFDYSRFYRLSEFFQPDIKHTLMIGGAGYSFPKFFLEHFPTSKIDVVEIDPGMTKIAQEYFALRPNPRLNITHADARVFLRTVPQGTYDAIYGDAFLSYYSIPYQLTTKEAVEDMYRALADDGVVLLNLISAIEGDKGKFLRAEYATFKSVFAEVYLFPVHDTVDGTKLQNIMLVALKKPVNRPFTSNDPQIQEYLYHVWEKSVPSDMPLLTDEFAPVDQYMMENFL